MVSTHQLKFEAWCLKRVLNPMKNGGNSRFAKVAYLVFVAIWSALLFNVSGAGRPWWLIVPMGVLLGIILGKMWDVEVEYWVDRFNTVTITLGDTDE